MKKKKGRALPPPGEELIAGRQAVLEALRHGSPTRVLLLDGVKGEIIERIIAQARRKSVPLSRLSREDFRRYTKNPAGNQGVGALVPPFRYLSLEELVHTAKADGGLPFLLLLDHLEDPQNLGSIIRTADAGGVHGLVIPERRSVAVTPAVRKVAAGAAERARVAMVKNLSRSIEQLKREGFWIYGAEADGRVTYDRADYRVPLVLVIGSEGGGLSHLVRRHCDETVRIPMRGSAGSLNVAAAAAVLVFTALSRREE